MTYFLLKVSGVSMLESQIKNTKEGYEEYINTTSAFIILPKKKKWVDILKNFPLVVLEENDSPSGLGI